MTSRIKVIFMPGRRPSDLRIDLLASPAAPGLARTLVAPRLISWRIPHVRDEVFLVMSEIITNACEATPRQKVKLHFRLDRSGVLIAVWDGSPALPAARPAAELTLAAVDAAPEDHWDHGGGWGLPLVRALSTDHGVHPDPTGGKWTWARLPVPAPSAPGP